MYFNLFLYLFGATILYITKEFPAKPLQLLFEGFRPSQVNGHHLLRCVALLPEEHPRLELVHNPWPNKD